MAVGQRAAGRPARVLGADITRPSAKPVTEYPKPMFSLGSNQSAEPPAPPQPYPGPAGVRWE